MRRQLGRLRAGLVHDHTPTSREETDHNIGEQLEPFMENVDHALAHHNPSYRETTRALENAVVRLLTEWQAGKLPPDLK